MYISIYTSLCSWYNAVNAKVDSIKESTKAQVDSIVVAFSIKSVIDALVSACSSIGNNSASGVSYVHMLYDFPLPS